MCSLEQATAEWDGKSADDIRHTFKRHQKEDYFVDTFIRMLEFPHTQKGATWQLKAYLEAGNTVSANQIDEVYRLLPQLVEWESRLHVLQSIPFMPITAEHIETIEPFLRNGLQDKNKFVRAWSYNGFNELAAQHPSFSAEADQLLESAMISEAPSVKARIRNILKTKKL